MTLRIVTNDRVAPEPVVYNETDYIKDMKFLGIAVPFDEAGPVVSSVDEVREHAGFYADECERQYRNYLVDSYMDLLPKCHVCGAVVEEDERCAFDLDMNPHHEPNYCCGYHGCALEV